MQCSLGLVILVVITLYTCKYVNFDISDNISVNTNILTANYNVKHLSNICQHLSNVIKEC